MEALWARYKLAYCHGVWCAAVGAQLAEVPLITHCSRGSTVYEDVAVGQLQSFCWYMNGDTARRFLW